MTEAPGIGRRCEIKASCFQEAFKAIFETLGSKISHETCIARLLAASQPKPNPYNYNLVWYISIPLAMATFNDSA